MSCLHTFFKPLLVGVVCTMVLAVAQAQNTSSFIEFATMEETSLPVVPGRADNVLIKIRVSLKKEAELREINLSLKSVAALSSVEQVTVYATGKTPDFTRDSILFATTYHPAAHLKLAGKAHLYKGDNYVWVAARLKPGTSLLNKLVVSCEQLSFNLGKIKPVASASFTGNRMGLIIRTRWSDSAHSYRIPGLATTAKGTLLGVYDIRYNNAGDLQDDIDVGLSRSTDGGTTWEPMKVIMDMGTYGGLPQDQNGIGDPSILVDKKRNTIWVAAIWAHGTPKKRTWTASQPGMTPSETGQFMLVKSNDDGITWSEPINITHQVKQPHWYLLLQGPGKGITMEDGTLVFPAQYIDSNRVPYSTIIYSKDGGTTWKAGTGARSNTTEAQVVELIDGSLMLNMRDNRGGSRAVAVTKDLGNSWAEHSSSRNLLDEPVCMASLDRFLFKKKDGTLEPLLLFSNPDSKKFRDNITIKISRDDGITWPKEYAILLDKGRGWGYSCLTQIDDYTVGILYESSKAHMLFQKIDLREVLTD